MNKSGNNRSDNYNERNINNNIDNDNERNIDNEMDIDYKVDIDNERNIVNERDNYNNRDIYKEGDSYKKRNNEKKDNSYRIKLWMKRAFVPGIVIVSLFLIYQSIKPTILRPRSVEKQIETETVEDNEIQSLPEEEEEVYFEDLIKDLTENERPQYYNIPTDNIAVARIEGDTQIIENTIGENGFSPSVIIVQRDLDTTWKIDKSKNAGEEVTSITFPIYNAQVTMKDGKNEVYFIGDSDFYFYTLETPFFGYIKVVDDINTINLEEIKKEVEEFDATIIEYDEFGVPSCH